MKYKMILMFFIIIVIGGCNSFQEEQQHQSLIDIKLKFDKIINKNDCYIIPLKFYVFNKTQSYVCAATTPRELEWILYDEAPSDYYSLRGGVPFPSCTLRYILLSPYKYEYDFVKACLASNSDYSGPLYITYKYKIKLDRNIKDFKTN